MDFLPSEDQRALQSGIRDLLAQRFPAARLHEVAGGFLADLWRELADTGVFSLRVSESDGGLGLGMADAVLVFEELGAACVPGPLVATFLANGLVPGDVVTAIDGTRTPVVATHLPVADALVVVGTDDLRVVAPDAVPATEVSWPLDPLTPLHELASLPSGEPVSDAADVARWRREGAVLTAALQVGIADRLTTLSVAYAKEREQFGRTIGAFQAVKHICADMLVRTELARVAVHAAAVTLDDPEVGDVGRAVAGAKLLADEAALGNSRAGVQVHGGMGFTWEVDVHFYLKRAWLHATEWGSADDHAEDLAELL